MRKVCREYRGPLREKVTTPQALSQCLSREIYLFGVAPPNTTGAMTFTSSFLEIWHGLGEHRDPLRYLFSTR